MPRAERRQRADEFLRQVGLREFGAKHPHELSGGMQQRVAIARALCVGADIPLMDEPFAALDVQTRAKMQDFLLDVWRDSGASVLFVTHHIDEAVALADRVVVFTARPGRIKTIVDTRFDKTDRAIFKNKAFIDKVDEIWDLVRIEAIKAQGGRAIS